jgi:hypothetical protein
MRTCFANISRKGSHVTKSFKYPALTLLLASLAFALPPLQAQKKTETETGILWKETLTPEAKGTRMTVPKSILNIVRADPDDCLDPSGDETTEVDGYRVRKLGTELVAIWGKGSCFCSPTGNCAFWIFRSRQGNHGLLFHTYMVREFGFRHSASDGLPDLVLWSHDSAQRFPGTLWRFDGKEYVRECAWKIVSSFKDVQNGVAQRVESHVENNSCKLKLIPESESEKTD